MPPDPDRETPPDATESAGRLIAITLDESLMRSATAEIAHERDVAIYDLLDENIFSVAGAPGLRYRLHLSIAEKRLVFDLSDEDGKDCGTIILSLSPFRRIVRDYFLICESYYDSIRNAPPSRIEAIDMGRRGLHDEGSRVLRERLEGKANMDFVTARRLFTLVCALHWKG